MACDVFCLAYTTALPQSVWPVQPYPATLGPYLSTGALLSTQKAWNFFELVEAHDAQQRQQAVPRWYEFVSTAEYELYNKGKKLHVSICRCVDWTPQRYQAPVPAGSDVRPQLCA